MFAGVLMEPKRPAPASGAAPGPLSSSTRGREGRASPLHSQLLGDGMSASAPSAPSGISARRFQKIPYGTMRSPTGTPAPPATCLVPSRQGDSLGREVAPHSRAA